VKRQTVCLCIKGWHFPPEFYRTIKQIPDVDVFVVSHKPAAMTPTWLRTMLPASQILIEPDCGYDWGAYQQFIDKQFYRDYEYVIFMHDDIVIKDPSFIQASIQKLCDGHSVVGNGKEPGILSWTEISEAYAHSTWQPPDASFSHGSVRGSFFATTTAVLDKLGQFEVYWDRWLLNDDFANWSLISSCGKLQHLLGDRCFGYLSDTQLDSPYMLEFVRGAHPWEDGDRSDPRHHSVPQKPQHVRVFLRIYRNLCRRYARSLMQKQFLTARLLEPIVQLPNRRIVLAASG
jgi:hypothetical protein